MDWKPLGLVTVGFLILGTKFINPKRFGADMTNAKALTLYKQTSSGSLREWTISLKEQDGDYVITMADGQVGGKIKESKPTVIKAKGGRTPFEQGILQYESKIKKKIDEGYKESKEEAQKDVFIRPMLALDFKKRGHSMDYPATVQRKFDGVRCIAYLDDEENVILESRRGKEFPHLNHIRKAIRPHLEQGRILDGELYSDDLTFQRVVGLVRKESLNAQDEQDLPLVSYRIYDAFGGSLTDKPFTERYDFAKSKVSQIGSPLALVENFPITSASEIKPLHDRFVKEGYEGAMIRNPQMPYEMDKRSSGLMKFKEFKDDEYEIVGFEEGTGNDAGTVIWVCKTPSGDTFKVRPRGTIAERAKALSDAPNLIGEPLTVRYFELTDDGIPRFPVGISIRNYE